MLAITLLRRLLLHRRDSAAARHEESGGHAVTLAEEDDALRALDAHDRAIVARGLTPAIVVLAVRSAARRVSSSSALNRRWRSASSSSWSATIAAFMPRRVRDASALRGDGFPIGIPRPSHARRPTTAWPQNFC